MTEPAKDEALERMNATLKRLHKTPPKRVAPKVGAVKEKSRRQYKKILRGKDER